MGRHSPFFFTMCRSSLGVPISRSQMDFHLSDDQELIPFYPVAISSPSQFSKFLRRSIDSICNISIPLLFCQLLAPSNYPFDIPRQFPYSVLQIFPFTLSSCVKFLPFASPFSPNPFWLFNSLITFRNSKPHRSYTISMSRNSHVGLFNIASRKYIYRTRKCISRRITFPELSIIYPLFLAIWDFSF